MLSFPSPLGYVHGLNVIAETSFEITNDAHSYEWRDHGVKLHIPQDSLPEDSPQCRVEIRASLSGQYTLPANCELVSGVYWVHSTVKLSKHPTLEIQHCSTQREGLSFIRAECTQHRLCPPYSFKKIEGGVFSEQSSYGSIELPQDSLIGVVFSFPKHDATNVTSMLPSTRQYMAQIHLTTEDEQSWRVYFRIMWNSELYIQVN